jgi:cytochrome c-type biogenesis protein CcmH
MRLLAALAVALALAAPALASETHPTLIDLEDEIVCPACGTTLDQSNSEIARQMKAFITRRIAAGDSKAEIKASLVDEFGEAVLAAPPRRGFNLLAWVLPIAGILLAAAVLGVAAWRWRSAREPEPPAVDPRTNGHAALDPELERRLDEELARFEA